MREERELRAIYSIFPKLEESIRILLLGDFASKVITDNACFYTHLVLIFYGEQAALSVKYLGHRYWEYENEIDHEAEVQNL